MRTTEAPARSAALTSSLPLAAVGWSLLTAAGSNGAELVGALGCATFDPVTAPEFGRMTVAVSNEPVSPATAPTTRTATQNDDLGPAGRPVGPCDIPSTIAIPPWAVSRDVWGSEQRMNRARKPTSGNRPMRAPG